MIGMIKGRAGQIKPSEILLSFMAFTFVILAMILLMSDANSVDNSFVNDTQFAAFQNTFNKMAELNQTVNSTLKGGLEETTTTTGGFGPLLSLVGDAFQTLKALPTTLNFIFEAFNAMSGFFGLPTWVPALITMALLTSLIFAIFGLIFNRAT